MAVTKVDIDLNSPTEAEPQREITYVSPSSAAVFDQCARRWKFKYIDGQREPSGEAALVGSFAHEVLEKLCEAPAAERSIEQAKIVASETWVDFADVEDFTSLNLGDDETRAFRWKAWHAIAGLWKLEDPKKVEVVATEQKIETMLGEVPFVGVVDRLERESQNLIVSDYKSGKAPKARWQDDKLTQVLLYAAAVEASMGETPTEARLLYLGQSVVSVTSERDRLDEAVGGLSKTWSQITESVSSGQFEANTSVLCGWCPFVDQCPEGQAEIDQRLENGNLPSHAPAAKSHFDDLAAEPTLD